MMSLDNLMTWHAVCSVYTVLHSPPLTLEGGDVGATLELSEFVVDTSPEEIPADVYHLAKRAFMNFVGLAL